MTTKAKKSFESKQNTWVETYYSKEAALHSSAAALSHRGLFLVPDPETLEGIVSFWRKKNKKRRKPSGAICLWSTETNRGPCEFTVCRDKTFVLPRIGICKQKAQRQEILFVEVFLN